MKNKGFTLIELLAVIVILAIIALIAVPIILNIIEDARKESDERSVELYASAIKNGIATHQLRTGNEVLPGTYNETNPLPFTVEYEGKVECTTTEIYEDGKIYLEGCTVNGGEETYNYGTKQENEDAKVWRLTKAEGNTGESAEIGDTIAIGNSESFYVYSNENGYIKAIAKYNLEVGNSTNSNNPATTETNLQSPNALGYKSGYTTYATVKYSSSSSDYVGSIVEGYVNTYKTKLESMGATFVDTLDDTEDPDDQLAGSGVRLITKKELENLGCSSSSYSCSGAPSFIRETSYWSSSASDNNGVWNVYSNGNFNSGGYSYFINNSFGVRPIIIILESSI